MEAISESGNLGSLDMVLVFCVLMCFLLSACLCGGVTDACVHLPIVLSAAPVGKRTHSIVREHILS